MSVDISNLAKQQWQWVESMGWHNKTNLECLALICSEVGEACNETRSESITDNFGTELADIILRTVDLAFENDIDIANEISKKMKANSGLKPGYKGRVK